MRQGRETGVSLWDWHVNASDVNRGLDSKFNYCISLGRLQCIRFQGSKTRRVIVTKKEIVKAISEELGLTQLKTKEIVQRTFDSIIDTLVEDGRIELRNFGVFEVKKRAARKARNPRTGGQVEVPAKFVVTFKPGKEMEAKVRELEERELARRIATSGSQPYRSDSSGLQRPPGNDGVSSVR